MTMLHPTFKRRVRFLACLILFCSVFSNEVSAESVDNKAASKERFTIQQIVVQGNTLLSQEAIQKVVKKFIGSNKSLKDLENIRDAVYGEYRKTGYALVSIGIMGLPDAKGILTVLAKEDTLRAVKVEGNKYLTRKDVLRLLPALQVGRALNVETLDKQVVVANDNSSRTIAVALQTIDVGVFDAIVKVAEQKMITHMLSLDNTGNRAQDPLRYTYRFIHKGLGQRKDAMGILMYARSPNGNVQQYLAYYSQPLGVKGNSIYAMALKSKSSYGLTDTGYGIFNMAGSGQFYGIHYVHSLYRSPATKLTLDLGVDFRSSFDDTDFEGIDMGPDINSRPISLSTHYSWTGKTDSVSMQLTYVRNFPGGYLNDEETFLLSRVNSSPSYQLWRANLTYLHYFKNGWVFLNRYDGQYTSQPLIPDEQYGVGGAHSVRGFEEREAAGDKGVSAGFELYTPPIIPGIRLLAFYDIGQIWAFDDAYGDLLGPQTLSSTGLGIRWTINKYLSFSADYAYVIKGYITPDHDKRIHFNLSATY